MKNHWPHLCFFVLVLAAAITLACGSSSSRLLQTVTVTPATADAQDYPDGAVPFTATGYFTTSPMQVTPLTASWGACLKTANSEEPTAAISVNGSGVAKCVSGAAAGTYTVFAYGVNPQKVCPYIIGPCGQICGSVVGYAQLTCP